VNFPHPSSRSPQRTFIGALMAGGAIAAPHTQPSGDAGLRAVTGTKTSRFVAPMNHPALPMRDVAPCILQNKPTRGPGEVRLRDLEITAATDESAANDGKRVAVTA
jgi:hypothetical protein